jgi:hypothetical protein
MIRDDRQTFAVRKSLGAVTCRTSACAPSVPSAVEGNCGTSQSAEYQSVRSVLVDGL